MWFVKVTAVVNGFNRNRIDNRSYRLVIMERPAQSRVDRTITKR